MSSSKLSVVIASAALAVAVLGSTPVGNAAARLVVPSNSVGAPQLKKNSVTGLKIKSNSITGAKVKNGSLTKADFMAGQLPAGPQGLPGAAGPAGPTGATGPTGISGYEILSQNLSVPSGVETTNTIHCSAGKTIIGGGHYAYWPLVVEGSHFSGEGAWGVTARNLGVSTVNLAAYAICGYVKK